MPAEQAGRQNPPTPSALWRHFAEQCDRLSTGYRRVSEDLVAGAILGQEAPGAAFTDEAVERFPGVAGPNRPRAATASEPVHVVGTARFAVAETGSLLVDLAPEERRAGLLADHLWLLIRDRDIVPTLDDALTHIGALIQAGQPYVTLMSGPSRTADIERVLTLGVHGPRRLTVLVVGGRG